MAENNPVGGEKPKTSTQQKIRWEKIDPFKEGKSIYENLKEYGIYRGDFKVDEMEQLEEHLDLLNGMDDLDEENKEEIKKTKEEITELIKRVERRMRLDDINVLFRRRLKAEMDRKMDTQKLTNTEFETALDITAPENRELLEKTKNMMLDHFKNTATKMTIDDYGNGGKDDGGSFLVKRNDNGNNAPLPTLRL